MNNITMKTVEEGNTFKQQNYPKGKQINLTNEICSNCEVYFIGDSACSCGNTQMSFEVVLEENEFKGYLVQGVI